MGQYFLRDLIFVPVVGIKSGPGDREASRMCSCATSTFDGPTVFRGAKSWRFTFAVVIDRVRFSDAASSRCFDRVSADTADSKYGNTGPVQPFLLRRIEAVFLRTDSALGVCPVLLTTGQQVWRHLLFHPFFRHFFRHQKYHITAPIITPIPEERTGCILST